MRTLGNAGGVGLVFVLAAVLSAVMWHFLVGSLSNNSTYSFDVLFDDARGATAETPVTLAGVQIGKVERVKLTPAQKADLKLQVKQENSPSRTVHGSPSPRPCSARAGRSSSCRPPTPPRGPMTPCGTART